MTAISRRKFRSKRLLALLALAAGFWAVDATADSDTRIAAALSGYGTGTDGDTDFKNLNFNGYDYYSVETTAADSTLWIVFNASCSSSGDSLAWVDLDIVVDGSVVTPTNGDNAQCAGTTVVGDFVSASSGIEVVTGVGAGTHIIEVRARFQPGVAQPFDRWTFSGVSLVVVVRESVP